MTNLTRLCETSGTSGTGLKNIDNSCPAKVNCSGTCGTAYDPIDPLVPPAPATPNEPGPKNPHIFNAVPPVPPAPEEKPSAETQAMIDHLTQVFNFESYPQSREACQAWRHDDKDRIGTGIDPSLGIASDPVFEGPPRPINPDFTHMPSKRWYEKFTAQIAHEKDADGRRYLRNAVQFLCDGWLEAALEYGWSEQELFKVNPNGGWQRLDLLGAAFFGGRVIAVTPEFIRYGFGNSIRRSL